MMSRRRAVRERLARLDRLQRTRMFKIVASIVVVSVAAGLLLTGPAALVAASIPAAVMLLGLRRLGAAHGGVSGDYLGVAVVCGELCACLGWLLTHP